MFRDAHGSRCEGGFTQAAGAVGCSPAPLMKASRESTECNCPRSTRQRSRATAAKHPPTAVPRRKERGGGAPPKVRTTPLARPPPLVSDTDTAKNLSGGQSRKGQAGVGRSREGRPGVGRSL